VKRLIVFFVFMFAVAAPCGVCAEIGRALPKALPSRELGILLAVGSDYGLKGDTLRLLLAIRKVENGRPGYEMGVASDFPNHRSHRCAGDLDKSLRLQAQWAAGTIKKHYAGDVNRFARRYCPPKAEHWARLVTYWMNKE